MCPYSIKCKRISLSHIYLIYCKTTSPHIYLIYCKNTSPPHVYLIYCKTTSPHIYLIYCKKTSSPHIYLTYCKNTSPKTYPIYCKNISSESILCIKKPLSLHPHYIWLKILLSHFIFIYSKITLYDIHCNYVYCIKIYY